MNEIGELVTEIETKVKQLIAEKISILAQVSELKNRNEELLMMLREKDKLIEEQKIINDYIEISQSVKHSEGNKDVKNKIDELVREIEKCIGLLNK